MVAASRVVLTQQTETGRLEFKGNMEQNGDAPATKKDLAELEQRLKAHVEHIETKLSSVFHGWPSGTNIEH